jgi:hypothetical protein
MALLGLSTRITIDIETKVGQQLQDWRNTEAVGCNNRLVRAGCDHDETSVVRGLEPAVRGRGQLGFRSFWAASLQCSPLLWRTGRRGVGMA